jgi:hypothetical protein
MVDDVDEIVSSLNEALATLREHIHTEEQVCLA